MSRIDPIMKNLIGTESPDDLATEVLGVLTEGSNVPEAGNFYVFVYRAKTPGIAYDSHPLVAVTEVFQWGFKGLNYHWGEMRQYTFPVARRHRRQQLSRTALPAFTCCTV